jgi:hypothetical protein
MRHRTILLRLTALTGVSWCLPLHAHAAEAFYKSAAEGM